MGNLVIGIDSSTQSSKAIAWNRKGEIVAENRYDIPLHNPSLDRFEQNTEDWWKAFCNSTILLSKKIDMNEVDGLSISNQRETLALLDENGNSVMPAILWMDKRCLKEVEELNSLVGENKIHEITGRPKDPCPCVYSILWIKKNEPNLFKKIHCFADVQTFLVHKLCGDFHTGWISSDPLGMFDVVNKKWSKEIIKHLNISENQLPKSFKPGSLIGKVNRFASNQTGLRENLPIYAAGGDGQLASLATNCVTSDRAYINLGSSIVSGVWSEKYEYSHSWRTEIAAQGDGYIFENVLLSGAIMTNWFIDNFIPKDRKDRNFFPELEKKIYQIPIGSDGLITLPYITGVMDPFWDPNARGVISGLNLSHTPYHIYRSIIEGLTMDSVLKTINTELEANIKINEYLAIGGGANSSVWRQMLADISNKNVLISNTVEASSLGAAMLAAYGSKWFSSIYEASSEMSGKTKIIKPDNTKKQQYDDLLGIYKEVYFANKKINNDLVKFSTH